MLTATQIKTLLRSHGADDMSIGAGAAMVLRGLRESTRDIDAELPSDRFEAEWTRHGSPPLRTSPLGSRMFAVPGAPIDVFERLEPMSMATRLHGVRGMVETPEALLVFYRGMGRAKDRPWIEKLESELSKGHRR
jgi:hypothetical protein